MKTVLVASTRPYSGKSGICLALVHEFAERGHRTAYFKPYGTMPVSIEGVVTDEDAAYVSKASTVDVPLTSLCPVVETRALLEDVLSADASGFEERVRESFEVVGAKADVVVAEGPGSLSAGHSLGVDTCKLASMLGARVVLVDKPHGIDLPDEVLHAAECLGERLTGVIFNAVHESTADFVREGLAPFLERRGVPVFGVIGKDPLLSSVTVAEIVQALGGTVLSAEASLHETVESFMVGAMGQDKALRYFRRRARKAVITGGDRSDVQLAALETDTRCIILTGNLPPSSVVLARADEMGVPMVLVGMDTLSAVEKMEALLGRVRLHDPRKADRIRAMFREEIDVDALVDAVLVN
ncbi:MAG: phosphotransacetylase family protein [Coriobacteriia bacterium]|nr:phosphotransacetylase family protein [Coriobacteriia bacterium]